MASLQARSPLRSAHLLLFLNKLVSLVALTVLLAGGWMAVTYLRTELSKRDQHGSDLSAPSKLATVEKTEPIAPDSKPKAAPLRLVYSCGGDAEYYHTQAHLPSSCTRTALSEEAAARRGLKRCRVCLPE